MSDSYIIMEPRCKITDMEPKYTEYTLVPSSCAFWVSDFTLCSFGHMHVMTFCAIKLMQCLFNTCKL